LVKRNIQKILKKKFLGENNKKNNRLTLIDTEQKLYLKEYTLSKKQKKCGISHKNAIFRKKERILNETKLKIPCMGRTIYEENSWS
jgi:hypothetical protein